MVESLVRLGRLHVKRLSLLLLLAVLALAACSSTGSSQGSETTTTPEPPASEITTTTAPEAPSELSASELGELFRQALNSGDLTAVAALAPTVASENLQDVIGIGPYEAVDCVILQGRDVCSISHDGTPYDFVLDLSSGLVTEIFYTGGG